MIFEGVNNTMLFSIISFIYMLFFAVLFAKKKKIKTLELSVFMSLIIVNIVSLFVECSLVFLIMNHINFVDIALKFFNCCLFTYIILIYIYTYLMAHKISIINRQSPKFIGVVVFYIICVFSMFLLPVYLNDVKYMQYSYGPSVWFLFGSIAILVFGMFASIISHYDELKTKAAPIIVLIALLTVNVFVQFLFPTLLLANSIISLVTFIMYFTVENPDIKLVNELELAKEAAIKANRSKTDFLSSMSHEIRTPLNAIVGFSDCIMDANSVVEAKENAKDIVNASQTLLEIVNGILDISKIEAGKIDIINTKYNAMEIFTELATLITPRMNDKGLDFTYEIDPSIPATLFGDQANIKKVVTNFLSNAVKYTDHGFVRYEVHSTIMGDYARIVITVEDSGRGIKKESAEKMFTRFQRLDEDKNTAIEGTGLGLAITKQLTELMGGKVIVRTEYGRGSKFTAVLNQKIEEFDAPEEAETKKTLDLFDVNILIVDDAPLNLKVATKLFQKYNANKVETCSSGFECIDRIRSGKTYDIIFLDDMMPKMSGVETYHQLTQYPNFHTPTVALTANAISGMREKYLSEGFNDYLAKPIDQTELIRVCNSLLGRSSEPEPVIVKPVIEEENRDDKNKIIPVEDNIEEILGDLVELRKKEEEIFPTMIASVPEETPKTVPTVAPVAPVETVEVAPVATIDVAPIAPIEPVAEVKPATPEVETLEVETLDDEPSAPATPTLEVAPIDLVPVADLNIPDTPAESSSSEVYDRAYLEKNGADVEHGLELLGDMEMYNMTIQDFLAEVDDKWKRINDTLAAGNMEDYSIDVHSLKSDCKYLGFMGLADIAYDHELKSKAKELDYCREHFPELEKEYNRVIEVIRNYASANPVEE